MLWQFFFLLFKIFVDDYINKAGIIKPNLRPKKDLRRLLELSIEKPSDDENIDNDNDVNMFEG